MNTGIPRTSFSADRHPDENQLLLALEREVSQEELAEIEQHVGACWTCRARYHEIQRGILAFVEYREKVYVPSIEPAPRDFRGFPYLLRTAAQSLKPGLIDRIRTRLTELFTGLAQISLATRWISATATAMVAVLFWTLVLNPTALPASELLTRAARVQNPAGKHLKVRQQVRLKTATTDVVHEFQWETGGPIPNAKWDTLSDPEHWGAPLTAEGFAEWRDSLSVHKDDVRKNGSLWTLETTVTSGPIRKATIVIRNSDFRPTEQHIFFADERRLDLEEVSFQMVQVAPAPALTPQPVPSRQPDVITQTPSAVVAPPIDLDEAELDLRYTIFTRHWDEGEDLQIARANDAVMVTGTASSAERMRQMQATLSSLPGVRSEISAPGVATSGQASSVSRSSSATSAVPLLKDSFDRAFASAAARNDFVDGCLIASDSALSHAWALKKLAERYTDADRRGLNPDSQAKLAQILSGHLQQLAAANTTLNGLIDMLPPSRESLLDTPTAWPSSVLALFDLVQQQDSVVAALVAGTQTSGQTAVSAAERFRSAHAAIARLTAELKVPGMR